MKTFHLQSLPKGMIGRKIQVANVVRTGLPAENAITTYKEAYRVRLNSRQARQLRRNKTLT